MLDNVVHMRNLLNVRNGSSAVKVESRGSTVYINNISGGEADSMTIEPWQSLIDTSQRFDMVQAQNSSPEDISHDIQDSHNAGFHPVEAGNTEQKYLAPPTQPPCPSQSLAHPALQRPTPPKYPRPKTTHKQDTKAARKTKAKTPKLAATDLSDNKDAVSKRNKHLRRNKVAATKCRQKKKVWVKDLEAQKNELEGKHRNIHELTKTLIDEVTQLKHQLMAHSGCGDSRIDGWIESEAKRFVQQTTDADQGSTSSQQQRLKATLLWFNHSIYTPAICADLSRIHCMQSSSPLLAIGALSLY